MKKLNIGIWIGLLKHLRGEWEPLDYKYKALSAADKKAFTEPEFNYLVNEIRILEDEEKNGVTYQ